MPSFSQLLTRCRDASGRLVLLIVSDGFALATLDLFAVNIALAIGVAILIAVLGTHSGAHALLDAFEHSWLVIGAFAAAAALASLAILGVRRPALHRAPTGATVPIDGRFGLAEEA